MRLTGSRTDVLIGTDAAGSGGCAALALFLDSEDSKPLLLTGFVSKEDQELASGANLIFVLELHKVVAAPVPLACPLKG